MFIFSAFSNLLKIVNIRVYAEILQNDDVQFLCHEILVSVYRGSGCSKLSSHVINSCSQFLYYMYYNNNKKNPGLLNPAAFFIFLNSLMTIVEVKNLFTT